MIGHTLKSLVLAGATSRLVSRMFAPLARGQATILMLHRFRDRERGVAGHDPDRLRRLLERLRRDRFTFVPLGEVFWHLEHREPLPARAVAFTLDDGYADQAEIAGPLFAEFDCPATIFVATGFLDGEIWGWWDQVEYVIEATQRPSVRIVGNQGGDQIIDFATANGRSGAVARFVADLKTVPDGEKHARIRRLALAAEVELPPKPPPRYAPMSWTQLRELEEQGVTFGPHTVTHPILSRADDAQARHEIAESWSRLRVEATGPVPVFCYPNGQCGDFGEREFSLLRELDLVGAVTGQPGYASDSSWEDQRFRVPRFAYDDELAVTLQYLNGFERLKQRLRGAR